LLLGQFPTGSFPRRASRFPKIHDARLGPEFFNTLLGSGPALHVDPTTQTDPSVTLALGDPSPASGGIEARSSRSDDASAEPEGVDVPRAATRSGASTA
jgi:hypothetical protein